MRNSYSFTSGNLCFWLFYKYGASLLCVWKRNKGVTQTFPLKCGPYTVCRKVLIDLPPPTAASTYLLGDYYGKNMVSFHLYWSLVFFIFFVLCTCVPVYLFSFKITLIRLFYQYLCYTNNVPCNFIYFCQISLKKQFSKNSQKNYNWTKHIHIYNLYIF